MRALRVAAMLAELADVVGSVAEHNDGGREQGGLHRRNSPMRV